MPRSRHSTDSAARKSSTRVSCGTGRRLFRIGLSEKAVDAYKKALSTERKSILALRNLLELYVNSGAGEDLRRLVKKHEADIHGNTDACSCLG